MKPKVLITVEGGIVQFVHSNTDLDVVIVDFDHENESQPVTIARGPQDDLFKNGESHKYVDDDEVKEYLKREKF
jgi:hypothetical protein